MKKGKREKNFKRIIPLLMISTLILLLFPNLSYANVFTDLADAITGRATSATTTVSISIGADAPNITIVSLNDTESVVAGGIRTIEFSAIVNDTNGDMNVTTGAVIANITSSGTTSSNSSCVLQSGNSSGGNWSCTVSINFYDSPGDWKVSVEATDNASFKGLNNTRYFTLQTTTAMNMTVSALTFPTSAPSARNVTASNNPNKVQNIGNKPYLNVSVTGINLLGDTNSATQISANNFTVRNDTGNGIECTPTALLGATLVNNTAVNIEGANISRGVVQQVSLYFCITHVPVDLITQTYSTGGTPNEDDWTIAVA